MSTAYPPPGAARTGTETVRADALRAQIESTLRDRFAGALSPAPRPVRETIPTGIEALDATLDGGVPLGAITELVGPLSSGRTGVALSTMAAAMREGSMCAWVDASDAFDPESAAANGVCLEQLLWVRCGVAPAPGGLGGLAGSAGSASVGRGGITQQGSGSRARAGQHPRDEVRGMDKAVGDLLREGSGRRDRSVGTPGAANRPLDPGAAGGAPGNFAGQVEERQVRATRSFGPVEREEQVSSDRQPKRGRGGYQVGSEPARPLDGRPGSAATPHARGSETSGNASAFTASAFHYSPVNAQARSAGAANAKPWARLDQALRAADLLLQAGGFRVLVLDLGSVAPEHVLRIPLATWFRFRAAADANRTVLLALTQTSCARSSAGLVVRFEALAVQDLPRLVEPCVSGDETASCPAGEAAIGGRNGLHLVESRTVESGEVENGAGEELTARVFAGTPINLSRVDSRGGEPCGEAKLITGIRYQAQPLRQRFSSRPISGKPAPGARRSPLATWQLSSYPTREQA